MVIWSMTSKQHGSGLGLHQLTPGYCSSGLVQNPVSPTPYVSPSKKDYEILFQPLFNEYFSPPPCVVSLDQVVVTTPRAVDPVGSPSSTTIDQDVPSSSTSPTNQEFIHQGVEEQIHGHQIAQFDYAPLLHNLSSDPSSKETTLQGVIPLNLHHLNQSFDTLTKLTKNNPLENAFGGNTRDLGSFGEETDKTTDLHQNLLKIMLTERGDGVASIKRRRHDLRSDGVSTLVMPSEHGRPKGTLEDLVSRD
ncbi:hypothetical protein Tco_0935333 [Tanacetum coccineum]